jgi:copper transport protein
VVVAVLCAWVVVLLLPGLATAHARLTASSPAAGSALAAMPESIELVFNEAFDLGLSDFQLTNAEGERLPVGAVIPDPSDPARLTIPIEVADAAPGVYTLVWRVLSAVDGHVTNGSVPFSVGTGQAPDIGALGDSQARPPWWQVIPRWFELSGWALLSGLAMFGAINTRVMQTADVAWRRQTIDRWKAAWFFAFTLALAGMIGGIVAQSLRVAGETTLTLPDAAAMGDVLVDTDYGRGWLLRLTVGVMLLVVLGLAPQLRRRWTWVAMSLLAVIAIGSISATGHAAAESRRWLAVLIDIVHMSCAGLWIGGLVALIQAIRPPVAGSEADAALTSARLVRNHSRTSLFCMATIIATGIASASFHVGGFRSLRTEDYGLTLLAKITLLIVVLVAAAINLLVLTPQIRALLARGELDRAGRHLRSTRYVAMFEVAVASLILLATSILTVLAPADYPLPVDVAGRAMILEETLQAGDLEIGISAELRGNPGDEYAITVRTADGSAPDNLQRVIIESELLTGADAGLGDRFDAEAREGSSGVFAFPATRLGIEGEWAVNVVIRRAGVEDVEAGLQIDTTGTAAGTPRLVDDTWRLPAMTPAAWGFGILAVAVVLAGLTGMRRLTGMEPVASGVILAMCVLIAAGFFVSATRQTVPVTSGQALVNPLPEDAITLQQGESLFAANCLLCHGADGRGSTAPGMSHAPDDADLTTSSTRRQTDGDLFTWISEGVPATDMPTFDEALSEEERWALVHYIRMLQE